MLILTGKWYDNDQHDSFILIEKYGNSLQIKIRRGGQRYDSPLSVAEKIKWNGTKLEFIERRSGYDVFYELTLKDNTTLVGTRAHYLTLGPQLVCRNCAVFIRHYFDELHLGMGDELGIIKQHF